VKRDQKRQGRYLGGKVPFGYAISPEGALVPLEGEQAIIARVSELRRAGAPLRRIQATVEAERGRKLSLDALARIVKGDD
jgi:hypothetical protein